MDANETSAPLERSVSQQSAVSTKSHRSTVRNRQRKLSSQPSSSASSLITAASEDKSLTSFPSFSPESPRDERQPPFGPDAAAVDTANDDSVGKPTPTRPKKSTPSAVATSASRSSSGTQSTPATAATTTATSAVDTLLSPCPNPLFDDDDALLPLHTRYHGRAGGLPILPGSLHAADDEHIERLIARHGAVRLVRQLAEDLAARDAQMTLLRRRADARERALRRIILADLGISALDLEVRLRQVEAEQARQQEQKQAASGSVNGARGGAGLEDLMNDAISEDNIYGIYGLDGSNDATIRARSHTNQTDRFDGGGVAKGLTKGWKDYLWGGTSKKSSRAGSMDGDAASTKHPTVVRVPSGGDRRPGLHEDLFSPPESDSPRSSSRASSVHSSNQQPGARKPSTSLASLALRLVAGSSTPARSSETDLPGRGRANSANQPGRPSSAASSKTAASNRAVSTQGGPKALMAMRQGGRATALTANPVVRAQNPDRWDASLMMGNTQPMPGSTGPLGGVSSSESYGPVEMDTILPPEIQPPTLTHIYKDYNQGEYLTDRFGFIYDQRRKKRALQRSAANNAAARHLKKGSRSETIMNGRADLSPAADDQPSGIAWDALSGDIRPDSPSSTADAAGEDGKPKRWQDYLKIATFPTELLSHTPSIANTGLEVMEARESTRSPGINSEDRGFLPTASTPSLALDSEAVGSGEVESATGTIVKEDAEPVKLLLQQLSELHDTLQREKTVRWNDFLRKVRAERRREGEAEAAAARESGNQLRGTTMMPEERLADGEMIGIAGLGHKGKVGRAKWNEFRGLVLGGIPVAYRAKIWAECSGAMALRIPGYYDDLVARPSEEDDPTVVAQIQMDIHRTLTDNIFFRKGPGVAKLNEVLLAYSRRNADVGYCQGMNLIAANLLLITPSAEDAFWILATMIEHILPPGYYDHSLLASRADQQVLRQYVAEVLPRLSQHLDELSIELEALTFQWFLSVFTDCLSAEALFRVWDVVLCLSPGAGAGDGAAATDGSTFLFQVALALLKLNEPQLLACTTPAQVYTYINHQMTNHAISIDGLVQASEALRRLVRREDVEARRDRAVRAEREIIRQRAEERSNALRLREAKQQKMAATAATATAAEVTAAATVVDTPSATAAVVVSTVTATTAEIGNLGTPHPMAAGS